MFKRGKTIKLPGAPTCLGPDLFIEKRNRHKFSSNVVTECLTLFLRIREVPVSNLDPKTGYAATFSLFSSVPPDERWDSIP
jgi:hypothetical protein